MNRKGFNLIELVVVVALVAILLSVASLSGKKIIEKRAVEEAKNQVAETMRNYAERTYNEGREYTIAVANGTLTVFDGGETSTTEIERVILPEMLNYYTATIDGVTVDGVRISTDGEKVEDDRKMIVGINGIDNEPKYRIEMWKKNVSELMDVSVIVE